MREAHPGADGQRLSLAAHGKAVAARLAAWDAAGMGRRLRERDPTIWCAEAAPGLADEIADRLGWLGLPATTGARLDDLRDFAAEIGRERVHHVVLLGMGGSSLAPEGFAATFGSAAGFPELVVLDGTHPGAVADVERRIELGRTLFVVSSKSGTTIETLSLFRLFWDRAQREPGSAGSRFVAITDPGTPLDRLGRERGFRRVIEAPPDVGGRYSALSVFGLAPAALIGIDVRRLLDGAATMAGAAGPGLELGLELGAALGELARAGRDKVTFLASPGLAAFPAWIEQLIAESTGKGGAGIVPVADEPLGTPDGYGADRFFVSMTLAGDPPGDRVPRLAALEAAGHPVARIRLGETADLGREMFRWEVAVAAAGAVLGINPFDQPDVQLAKDLARQAMAAGPEGAAPAEDDIGVAGHEDLAPVLEAWLATARPRDYVAVQAYLAPTAETDAALRGLRVTLAKRLGLATTLGYGPRFLHSTGQLHKGGPNTGLFLQLTDEVGDDIAVPETETTFGALIRAQALGDYRALRQRDRRVLRLNLGRDAAAGLASLADALE